MTDSNHSSRQPRWIRRWYVRLLLGVGVALALLALAEGAARLVSATSGTDYRIDPLPQLPRYKVLCPDSDGDGDGLKLCPDNRDKYDRVRPERFGRQPPAGQQRVIAVGESFVNGLNLKLDQAWPARLEGRLGAGVEVLNFGRCGTHTGLLHSIVEAAVSLRPDLLVLAAGNNEHTMTTFYVGWAGRHPLLVFNLLDVLSSWQLAGLVNRGLDRPIRPTVEWDVTGRRFDNPVDQRIYAARRRPPDLSWFKGGLAGREVTLALNQEGRLKEGIFRRHMQAMIDHAHGNGVRVLLATLPIQLTKRPELSGCSADDPDTCRRLNNIIRHLRDDNPVDRDAVIDRALALDSDVAELQYELGLRLLRQGKKQPAVAALHRASGLDLLPDNTPAINGIIRALAVDNAVPLVDLNSLSGRYLAQEKDLFLDRVHMNAAGSELVAAEVAGKARALLGLEAAAGADPP